MSENEKSVPKRRFKEFQNADPWEQRKVKELFKVTRGYVLAAPETAEKKSGEYPYPVYSSQTKNDGLMGYYKDYLYTDAITWTTDGANAGTVCLRSGMFYCTNVCGVLLSDNGHANKAVSEALNNVAWKHVSHVGNPKLMNNVMSEIAISLPPSMEEQARISELLLSIDNLITLHQRKLEKTKALKSAYLSEMFPKEGEREPKRRFAGFTAPWEQRKLTDEVELYSGLTYSPDDVIKDNGTLVLRSSNVKNGEVVDADNVYVQPDVVNSANVKVDDIIIVVRNGSRALIGKHAQIKVKMDNTVIGAFMTGMRSTNSAFTNALLSTPVFDSEVEKNLGATINQITNGMFQNMQFMFPSTAEQMKIGQYFTNIDNLITLHQRKLEKLQSIKKAYLNEMFI